MTHARALSPVDLKLRSQKLTESLAADDTADALLVSDLNNVRWLTGLSSSNAAAVVSHGAATVVTDSRYAAQAMTAGSAAVVVVGSSVLRSAMAVAIEGGARRVAVEAGALTVTELAMLQQAAAESVEILQTTGLVEALRIQKDSSEADALAAACEVSVRALAVLVDEIEPGMTEVVVARRLEQLFGELGAEDRAFPSIVATGPNSAIPHHLPTDRHIEAGDILKIDFGARVRGYHADCTRTFIVGSEPSARELEVHAAVAEAAGAARSALRVGVEVAEVYDAAWAILDSAGFAERFTHGLGHGVGLQIHEAPLIAKASAGTICDGSVVTIEPGVYLPGEFGVRIEDTCHVTASETTILTNFPRELSRIA